MHGNAPVCVKSRLGREVDGTGGDKRFIGFPIDDFPAGHYASRHINRNGELPNGLSPTLENCALLQHVELDAVERRLGPGRLIAAAQVRRHTARPVFFPEPHQR
jgi:hypothetical protein